MFDGAVVSYKVDTVIESQPKIMLAIKKNAQHIIILKLFGLRKALNNISFRIGNVNAAVVGGKRNLAGAYGSSCIDPVAFKKPAVFGFDFSNTAS